jgi:hypothetical protein
LFAKKHLSDGKEWRNGLLRWRGYSFLQKISLSEKNIVNLIGIFLSCRPVFFFVHNWWSECRNLGLEEQLDVRGRHAADWLLCLSPGLSLPLDGCPAEYFL